MISATYVGLTPRRLLARNCVSLGATSRVLGLVMLAGTSSTTAFRFWAGACGGLHR
jgi:hypothetical protein